VNNILAWLPSAEVHPHPCCLPALLLLCAVDYAVTIKRKIDSTGAKVKQPQEEVS
jgi:hypothetical protein